MPDEDKKMVPIDTSGPDAEVDIEEKKDEAVIEQPEVKEEGTDKTYENSFTLGPSIRIASGFTVTVPVGVNWRIFD